MITGDYEFEFGGDLGEHFDGFFVWCDLAGLGQIACVDEDIAFGGWEGEFAAVFHCVVELVAMRIGDDHNWHRRVSFWAS